MIFAFADLEFFALLAALLLAAACRVAPSDEARRPSMLLVTLDATRVDGLSVYAANEAAKTPPARRTGS